MLRKIFISAVLLLCLLSRGNAGWSGNVNTILTNRTIHPDHHFWLMFDIKPDSWPVALSLTAFRAAKGAGMMFGSGNRVSAESLTEVDIGAGKTWRADCIFRPFLGAGLALVTSHINHHVWPNTIRERKWGAGLWLGSGWQLTLYNRFNLGYAMSWRRVDIGLDRGVYETWQYGLLLGVSL